MKNLSAKFAVALCFCLITWGCEDETLTQAPDPLTSKATQEKATTTKDSKFFKGLKVSGLLEDGGTFAGKVTITQFGYSTTEGLWVSGVLKGTATTADGIETEINESFSQIPATLNEESGSNARMAAAQATQATCDILFLNLGPLHLDLLGLTVDLSEITLDINAVSGAGNLLGNLLCAVAGLLDPAGFLDTLIGTLTQLLALLNQINDLIG